MKFVLVVFALALGGVFADPRAPQPVLSILANECKVIAETPNDINPNDPNNPFLIPVELNIRFTAMPITTMLHPHWGVPQDIPDDLILSGYEVIVEQDDGVKVSDSAVQDPEATAMHVAADGAPGSTLITSVRAIYADTLNGNTEIQSDPAFYPPALTDFCCPNLHPPPAVRPLNEDRRTIVNEVDGGDFFLEVNQNEVTYFCHNGRYMSCFIVPEGFSDPEQNRFSEIGEVVTFVSDETGEDVDFQCILRELGNASGDDREAETSGSYVLVSSMQPLVEDFVFDIPLSLNVPSIETGIMGTESLMQVGNFIRGDPTLPSDVDGNTVVAAEQTGDEPYTIPPAEVVRIMGLNKAAKFHGQWTIPDLPEDSTFTHTGFIITTTQPGQDGPTIVSQVRESADLGKIHIFVDEADQNFKVDAFVVAVYEDENGNEVRSKAAYYPPSNVDACPLNTPIPKVLPPGDIDLPGEEGEVDGGFYTATQQNGALSWTYFCNEGVYKSCFHPPEGFSDPRNERFQEVGGRALFRNDATGEDVGFICVFSPTGDELPLDELHGEISGRFISDDEITAALVNRSTVDTTAGASVHSNITALVIILSIAVVVLVISLLLVTLKLLKTAKRGLHNNTKPTQPSSIAFTQLGEQA